VNCRRPSPSWPSFRTPIGLMPSVRLVCSLTRSVGSINRLVRHCTDVHLRGGTQPVCARSPLLCCMDCLLQGHLRPGHSPRSCNHERVVHEVSNSNGQSFLRQAPQIEGSDENRNRPLICRKEASVCSFLSNSASLTFPLHRFMESFLAQLFDEFDARA